jgi:hypothetical protein
VAAEPITENRAKPPNPSINCPPDEPGQRTSDGHAEYSGVWFPDSEGRALNAARLEGDDLADIRRKKAIRSQGTPEEELRKIQKIPG